MTFSEALRTVDTVTRVARKAQLMIKDAPKVGNILTEYNLDKKFAALESKKEPVYKPIKRVFTPIK